jgi:hypothetical protein
MAEPTFHLSEEAQESRLKKKLQKLFTMSKEPLCGVCFFKRNYKIRHVSCICCKCQTLTCSMHAIGYENKDKSVSNYCIDCYESIYGKIFG